MPPHNRQINIMKDTVFQKSQQAFTGALRRLRKDGPNEAQHKEVIKDEDLERMYERVLGNKNAWHLLYKVFFEVGLHFARRGREGLRELTKDSFIIKRDSYGVECVVPARVEVEKTIKEKVATMYSQPGDARCPVKSLKLYMSKLNPKCSAFYQYPKKKFDVNDTIWFDNKPIGKNIIGTMMQRISEVAELPTRYTNQCIRATCVTKMSHAGIHPNDIIQITGHRSTESLKSYVQGPSDEQKRHISNILHTYQQPKPRPATSTVTSDQGMYQRSDIRSGNVTRPATSAVTSDQGMYQPPTPATSAVTSDQGMYQPPTPATSAVTSDQGMYQPPTPATSHYHTSMSNQNISSAPLRRQHHQWKYYH